MASSCPLAAGRRAGLVPVLRSVGESHAGNIHPLCSAYYRLLSELHMQLGLPGMANVTPLEHGPGVPRPSWGEHT